MPHRAGLPSGHPGCDDTEQVVGLRCRHPGAHERLPGGRQQLGHQVGGPYRADLTSPPERPAQLGSQAVLRGPVEVMVGALERQQVRPPLILLGKPQREPEEERGIREHVDQGRASRQRTHLDAQMATRGRIVNGPVPAPYRPLVQPQFLQRRCMPLVADVKRLTVAEYGQQRLVQPHALCEQLQRPAPQPPRPERHTSQLTMRFPPVAVVDRLLAQGDPCLFPQPVAQKGGRVTGHRQHRCGRQLDGVEGAHEVGRVYPQMDLE